MNPITEPVKITSLELENVKRIRACAITPTQNGLTVIGGRNNQGKTSVLDAIAWALGGDRHRHPGRHGKVHPFRPVFASSYPTVLSWSAQGRTAT